MILNFLSTENSHWRLCLGVKLHLSDRIKTRISHPGLTVILRITCSFRFKRTFNVFTGDVVLHDAAGNQTPSTDDSRYWTGQEPLGRCSQRTPQTTQEEQDSWQICKWFSFCKSYACVRRRVQLYWSESNVGLNWYIVFRLVRLYWVAAKIREFSLLYWHQYNWTYAMLHLIFQTNNDNEQRWTDLSS